MAKNVFTTGQAARICGLSQQTIIRCFDLGKLKGFKVPGSTFRRIPREYLRKFMLENGISAASVETNIIVLGDAASGREFAAGFSARMNGHAGNFESVSDTLSFGQKVVEFPPSIVILDCRKHVIVPTMLAGLRSQRAKREEVNLSLVIGAIVRENAEPDPNLEMTADRIYTDASTLDEIVDDLVTLLE